MGRLEHGVVRLWRTLVVALVATSMAAIGMVGTAEPADAGNGDWYRLVQGIDRCLDSNYAFQVYVQQCSRDNDYQRWYLWFGGWVQNKQTGYCLTLLPGWDLGTRPCDPEQDNPYQFWQQWDGGWIRNPTDNACVYTFDGIHAFAQTCAGLPNGQAVAHQLWHQEHF